MKTSLTFLALAASALANPRPDAVTSAISPSSSAPAGCMSSVSGNFETQIVNVTKSSKRETPLEQRVVACGGSGTLVLTLQNGILLDAINRTGYIAANRQFQFDAPPQNGAKITAGWSICANQSLALGGSAIFYQCLSGTFYNLYDQSQGGQCSQVTIQTVACVGGNAPASGSMSSSAMTSSTMMSSMSGMSSAPMTSASSSPAASYIPAPPVSIATTYTNGTSSAAAVMSGASSGLKTASSATAVVKQSTDGQPQATTTASAGPALSTGKGSVLTVGKEVLALAAGVAAVFAF